jgi:hypothetical protein
MEKTKVDAATINKAPMVIAINNSMSVNPCLDFEALIGRG